MAVPAEKIDTERTYTLAEFIRLSEFNEQTELLDGRLVKKSVPTYEHSEIADIIRQSLAKFDPEQKLGVMRHEVAVSLREGYAPIPDLAFWVASRKPSRQNSIAPYPDWAIEIQSPDQSLKSLIRKVEEYLQAGVQLVWLIQPAKRVVTVYRAGQTESETVTAEGWLDGGDLLPGFKLAASQLFE